MPKLNQIRLTFAEWKTAALERYPDGNFAFVCASCKHRQTVKECQAAGVPEGSIGFSCIGRWNRSDKPAASAFGRPGQGPCNYAGGGLIGLNPIHVTFPDRKEGDFFDFAERPLAAELPVK